MPPKKGGGGGGGGGGGHGGGGDDVKAKEELVAVLLADSFAQTFRPVTLERPKALLPLANAPLIDYALEWLSGSKVVDEIVVFACAHARAIEAHLVSAGWMRPSGSSSSSSSSVAAAPVSAASPQHGGGPSAPAAAAAASRGPRVSIAVSTAAASVGDALRSLEQSDRLTGDFVLVPADVVANVDLKEAVRAHRERRARDRSAIATLLVRGGVTREQRARLGEASVCYVVDPASMRLLAIAAEDERQGNQRQRGGGDQASLGPSPAKGLQRQGGPGGNPRSKVPIPLDTRLFGERDAVALRSDLSPAHAAILSPEAAMLFSDNFDYSSFDADFVAGTLAEEELGNKIFLHVVEGPSSSISSSSSSSGAPSSSSSVSPSLPSSSAYLASVANLRAFDAVGRDVAARWSWPSAASPDGNGAPLYSPPSSTAAISSSRASESESESKQAAATSTWGRPTYRGGRSLLYRESGVRAARGAALGPDAVVGAGARIGDGAVVAGGSVVGRDSTIGNRAAVVGSVLGQRCVVGDGAVVLSSLLCDGAVVLPGARVERGCVLSFGVVIGAGSVVPAFSRVSLMRPKQVKREDGGGGDAQYSSDEAPDGFGRPGLATTSDDDGGDDDDDSEEGESDEGDGGSDDSDSGDYEGTEDEETSSSGSEANEDEAIVGSSASSMMRRRRAAQEKKTKKKKKKGSGARAGSSAADAPARRKRRGRRKKKSSSASSSAPGVGPPRAVAAAAAAAAAGMGPPPADMAFDAAVVGPGGAGYLWPSWSDPGAPGLPPPTAEELRGGDLRGGVRGETGSDESDESDDDDDAFYGRNAAPLGRGGGVARGNVALATAVSSAQQQQQQQHQQQQPLLSSSTSNAAAAKEAAEAEADDPDFHFRREVAETFLRCALLDYEEDLAVIELNSLKIAEDKAFADVARALAVTTIALAAPPPISSSSSDSSNSSGGGSRPEFAALYAPGPVPDVATPAGRRELLSRVKLLLNRWGPLLRRFLRDSDDQVELLLTLEEFCGEEGCFASTVSAHGRTFAAVFKELLHALYEADVVEEEALLAWADEKAHADASERQFLEKAMPLIQWLREASSEEEESNDEDE